MKSFRILKRINDGKRSGGYSSPFLLIESESNGKNEIISKREIIMNVLIWLVIALAAGIIEACTTALVSVWIGQ